MNKVKSRQEQLLNENPSILFFKLSIPGILGMLVFGLYQFVDGIFVGQFVGPAGMGAVGLAYPLSLLNNAISGLIGTGASSLISRSIGSGDEKMHGKIFPAVFLLNILISGTVTAVSFVFAPHLIRFMGGEGEMLELGITYMRIVITGTFFINFAASLNMLIRSEGVMKEAMLILASGAVLNIILDPILMQVFNMGIAGAAAATVISQIVCMLLSLFHIASETSIIDLNLNFKRTDWGLYKDIIVIGFSAMALPVMAIMEIVVAYRMLDLYATVNDVIALGTIFKIFSLLLPPVWGMAQGMQPFVGVNYGAGKHKRLLKGYGIFTAYATVFTTSLWIFLTFAPKIVTGWFITDYAVLEKIYHAPRIFFIMYPVYGFLFNTLILLQATGKSKQASVFVTCRMVIYFIPPMLIICPLFGAIGVWIANPISDILASLTVMFALFRYISSLRYDQEYE